MSDPDPDPSEYADGVVPSPNDVPPAPDFGLAPEDGNADYVEHDHPSNWDGNPEHGANTEDEKLVPDEGGTD